MSKYKCIIFDCDGVLVDSEPIGNQVMMDMANALGADIDLDYAYQHFKGKSLHSCMQQIEQRINKPLPSYFEKDYRTTSFDRFKREIKPVEGIHEVLKNLQLPYCVASSGPEKKMRLNLQVTGLLPFFESRMFSCYQIQKWKPDPAVFLWAAKTMGFSPQECLVIEDSTTGVEAALSGGFNVFGFTAQDDENDLSTLTPVTFNSMIKLLELI